MSLFRELDQEANTVQFLYKGEPITPKIKMDDPKALIEGLGGALNTAYNKLRDANAASH
jgi:hypothetical protein